MKIQNEVRRVRKKLVLFDQEALDWVLSDLIDQINRDLKHKEPVPKDEKIKMIERLKKSYLKYLKENLPDDPKQANLWND